MIKERINLVMIKILKNKKKIISIILIIMVIIGFILLNNNFKIIEKITNGKLQNADEETEEQPLISYQVYDNSDESKIKTLVNVNDNSGIEYVEYPDGRKLETNNKTQVSIDYEMTKDENYSFKIKTANNESIQEQTVCVNDEFINKNGVSILKTNQENGYEVLEIENKTIYGRYYSKKLFFIFSQQTIQLPPSNAHRLCAPNVANEKKSVLFRRIPNADCHYLPPSGQFCLSPI